MRTTSELQFLKQKRCGGGGGGGGGGNGFKLQAAASVNEANAAFAFQLSSALAKHWKSVTLKWEVTGFT